MQAIKLLVGIQYKDFGIVLILLFIPLFSIYSHFGLVFPVLYSTASYAAIRFNCGRRMLGSNPEMLQQFRCQSETLCLWSPLVRSEPHTA
jgi:hypothetical protein